ncbi:type II secretion system F family protein [Sedimentibacter sp. MB31-C6]|uniref:type II secretion system F family protein n=1 Tax=Sedimentibacter sp. MB31-C6 TaxID=3109366 RepID=UPI002DDD5E83|nr:type II secretion system F family protein [Sedimentibacter sp. MB36-C1]WSI03804.1 type II secretion system F family protein [Sedimentibacter sp. MB36-C1]
MISYKCNVIDRFGKKQKLKQYADSKEELVYILKKNNYIIIEIKKIDNQLANRLSKKIKSKDLAVFCKQLHSMLKAGITVTNSLKILKIQTNNKKFRIVIEKIYKDLLKGKNLSKAFLIYNEALPDLLISMIKVGELSGNLDNIMGSLSNYYEKENKIENKINSAMIYPAVLAFVSIVVVMFLLTSVMPNFIEMYLSSGVPLPTITKILINVSEFIKNSWQIILYFIIIFVFVISVLKKRKDVKFTIDYIKLKVPVYRNLQLKIATFRFTRTLATLLRCGVPMLEALDTISLVIENSYIGSKILKMKEDIKQGVSLSNQMKKQNIFPSMVHQMIRIGEDSGTIEEMLDKTADFYDEEVEIAVQRLTILIEPLMIIIMSIIIGFIVLAMAIPMFEMMQTVQY